MERNRYSENMRVENTLSEGSERETIRKVMDIEKHSTSSQGSLYMWVYFNSSQYKRYA